MLDDLAKTVKAQLYERVSSPLLGAFAISWVAWNYRFILVLISSMDVSEKFAYIDTNLFSSYQVIFLHGVLYPLLTTLALIFIYPIPAKFVYEYWRKRQRELKEIQQRIDDETPLTREEARELRHETLNARLEFEQELERKTSEIAKLKETIKEIQSPEKAGDQQVKRSAKSQPNKASSEANISLDKDQLEMLQRIAESRNGMRKDSLISSAGKDRIFAEYNLGELKAKGYVSLGYSTDLHGDAAEVTHLGRAYLVKQKNNLSPQP